LLAGALIGMAAILRGWLFVSHPERSEGPAARQKREILRRAQDDNPGTDVRDAIRLPWLSTWGFGLLLAVVFTGVHAFYWSNIRMRAPLVPLVAMAAAAGSAELVRRVWRRK